MRIECPNCKTILSAPDDAAGRKAVCRACRTQFIIQEPSSLELPPLRPFSLKDTGGPPDTRCSHCGTKLDTDAIICFRCGFNLQTGTLPARDEDVEYVEEEAPTPWYIMTIEFIGALVPGLFRPAILFTAALLSVVAFVVMGFCLMLVGLGVLIEACFVGGLGLLIYAQGLAMILQGEFGLIQELLSELDSRRWLLFFILLFTPFGLIYLVLHNLAGLV